jgi:hypothetical protein
VGCRREARQLNNINLHLRGAAEAGKGLKLYGKMVSSRLPDRRYECTFQLLVVLHRL